MAALPLPDFLKELQAGVCTIDVRTPAEFTAGHVPTAINLPLFTNSERAAVGTTYKQIGAQPAYVEGLKYVGLRMSWMVEEGLALAHQKTLLAYCWRGGMRSGSVVWLLTQAGLQVHTLQGGYKTWRTHVQEQLAAVRPLVLGGHTGSGKTEMLKQLARHNQAMLDLEYLACHKGSSFGGLMQPPQPTTEHFENLCAWHLRTIHRPQRVWVEDESPQIGTVHLPASLCKNMQLAPLVLVHVPREVRVQRLIADYAAAPARQLAAAIQRVARRVGPQHAQTAIKALSRGDYADVAHIMLGYYDRAYDYALSLRTGPVVSISVEDPTHEGVVAQLVEAAAAF